MSVRCGRLHGAAPAGMQPVSLHVSHVHLIVFVRTAKAPPLSYEYLISIWQGGGGG